MEGLEPRGRRASRWIVPLLVSSGIFAVTFLPALQDFLVQDDYWWLSRARDAIQSPSLLSGTTGGFLRPLETWTWVLGFWASGDSPVGHHAFNLALQWTCGLLFIGLLRRWGFTPWPAALLVSIWWVSPYALEATVVCSTRVDSVVLGSWLGMALVWPGPTDRWTGSRMTAVAALTALALTAKETWVVTPGWFLVLDLWHRESHWRSAMRTVRNVMPVVIAYVVVYLSLFSGTAGSFYELSARPLAKLAVVAAGFLQTAQLQAGGFDLSWGHLLAVGLLAILVSLALVLRRRYALAGLALAGLSIAPTLMSPFLPQRWCLAAYAGFLVFVGDLARGVAGLLATRLDRRVAAYPLTFVGLAALASQLAVARLDLADYRKLGEAYRQVVDEARAILPQLPRQMPIVVVRAENLNPLTQITREMQGVPKTLFQRPLGPYGLTEGAWLFDYVGIPSHLRAHPVEDDGRATSQCHALVFHLVGRCAVSEPARR